MGACGLFLRGELIRLEEAGYVTLTAFPGRRTLFTFRVAFSTPFAPRSISAVVFLPYLNLSCAEFLLSSIVTFDSTTSKSSKPSMAFLISFPAMVASMVPASDDTAVIPRNPTGTTCEGSKDVVWSPLERSLARRVRIASSISSIANRANSVNLRRSLISNDSRVSVSMIHTVPIANPSEVII